MKRSRSPSRSPSPNGGKKLPKLMLLPEQVKTGCSSSSDSSEPGSPVFGRPRPQVIQGDITTSPKHDLALTATTPKLESSQGSLFSSPVTAQNSPGEGSSQSFHRSQSTISSSCEVCDSIWGQNYCKKHGWDHSPQDPTPTPSPKLSEPDDLCPPNQEALPYWMLEERSDSDDSEEKQA